MSKKNGPKLVADRAICGKRPGATRDHIPPKGIFARSRPQILITVPIRLRCNKNLSKAEEAFRVYLSRS